MIAQARCIIVPSCRIRLLTRDFRCARFGYGNYSVVDLSTRLFLDPGHHQRVDLHLNNAFDRTYSSSLGHGVDDVSGNGYIVHNLALPRTFGVNYTYSI
jgi:hypothetical protein